MEGIQGPVWGLAFTKEPVTAHTLGGSGMHNASASSIWRNGTGFRICFPLPLNVPFAMAGGKSRASLDSLHYTSTEGLKEMFEE